MSNNQTNKRIPVKEQILTLLKSTPNWIAKEEFATIIKDFSPETINRTLRRLAETGEIKVEHYKGTHNQELTRYSLDAQPIPKVIPKKPQIVIINGRPVAMFN